MLNRAEDAGFAARSSGVPREANPHERSVTLPYLNVRDAEHRLELAEAWRRGWDRANADLSELGP